MAADQLFQPVLQVNSFLRADEELSKAAAGGSLADRESGSTALVAVVSGTQLLVANAGDSRRALWVTLGDTVGGLGAGLEVSVWVSVRIKGCSGECTGRQFLSLLGLHSVRPSSPAQHRRVGQGSSDGYGSARGSTMRPLPRSTLSNAPTCLA